MGGLVLWYAYIFRRPSLATRLARAEGVGPSVPARERLGVELPSWLSGVRDSYQRDLRQAGGRKTVTRFLVDKLLVACALPVVLLLPYAAAAGRLPSAAVLLLLAVAGFFCPDVLLRSEVKRRREAIFLDVPEAMAVLALALRAGQSLRQALELAARDCPGPLGEELTRALSLARRERSLGEREALVRVAREAGRRPSPASPSSSQSRRAPTSSSCSNRRARRAPSRTATWSAPPTAPTSPCTRRSRLSWLCSCCSSLTASFASSPSPSDP